MCGICGIFQPREQPVSRELIRKMTSLLVHRGPDGEGLYTDNGVGLGHRRLKIIDLSENGRQPMTNEDESIWIVFNGEIYNYKTLTDELQKKGHTFRSATDTEVIVHAYEEWGIQCLQRFNGMFAIAIYDQNKRRLYLVRDRIGIKPLFYAIIGDRILFASEIKAILADATLSREIDSHCLHNYLSLNYVTAPLTMFKHVKQILPGHYLQADDQGVKIRKYWDVSFSASDTRNLSRKQWLAEFEHHLNNAVKLRLVSDVPFGAFLSGGLDSSSITYFMSQNLNSSVKTFSIGFMEESFNELPDARRVADALKTEHYSKNVEPLIDEAFLKKLVWHYEEPTADSSAIPVYHLSAMTREKVTMALSGDGADEILAGYETYPAYYIRKMYRLIPRIVRQNLIARIAERLPTAMRKVSLDYKIKTFTRGAELPWQEAHYYWRTIFDEGLKKRLYNRDFDREVGDYATFDFIRPYFTSAKTTPLNAMLEVDTKFYLANDMLVKVDRASMAHSLEVRVPFLDHKLVEFVAGMPENLKLRNFHKRKYALSAVMSGKLPDAIVRKRKLGFNVPLNVWFQGPLKTFVFDTLSPKTIKETGIFEPKTVNWILNRHMDGLNDFSYPIWSLIVFVLWRNMFIDDNRPI